VARLELGEEAARTFLELGLTPGEKVRLIRSAPIGGPLEIEVLGYRLAIRTLDAQRILLK
jgi:Fe2+ transport system protein FeoA